MSKKEQTDILMPWEYEEEEDITEEDTKAVEISIGDDAVKELILKQDDPFSIQDKLRALFFYEEKQDDPFPINTRELYDFLGIGKIFGAWIRDMIDKYDCVEDQDYKTCFPNLESGSNGGQNKIDYYLTIDTTKEFAIVQKSDLGKLIRRYLIWAEKQLQQYKKEEAQQQQPAYPTMSEMEMIAAIAAEAVKTEKRLKALEVSKEDHEQRFEEIRNSTQEISERTANLEISTGLVVPDLPNPTRNKRLSGMIYTICEGDHYRMSELRDNLILYLETHFGISLTSELSLWQIQFRAHYGSLKGRGITPPQNVPRPSKIKELSWLQLVAAKPSWYQASISWLDSRND